MSYFLPTFVWYYFPVLIACLLTSSALFFDHLNTFWTSPALSLSHLMQFEHCFDNIKKWHHSVTYIPPTGDKMTGITPLSVNVWQESAGLICYGQLGPLCAPYICVLFVSMCLYSPLWPCGYIWWIDDLIRMFSHILIRICYHMIYAFEYN